MKTSSIRVTSVAERTTGGGVDTFVGEAAQLLDFLHLLGRDLAVGPGQLDLAGDQHDHGDGDQHQQHVGGDDADPDAGHDGPHRDGDGQSSPSSPSSVVVVVIVIVVVAAATARRRWVRPVDAGRVPGRGPAPAAGSPWRPAPAPAWAMAVVVVATTVVVVEFGSIERRDRRGGGRRQVDGRHRRCGIGQLQRGDPDPHPEDAQHDAERDERHGAHGGKERGHDGHSVTSGDETKMRTVPSCRVR